MVKVHYDVIEADYIDLEFVCKECGCNLKTGHIECPDCGEKKEILFKCTNPNCTFFCNINIVDHVTNGEVFISVLPDDARLIVKPCTYEDVANIDVSILDYITNSVVFNNILNEVEILSESTKQEIHRMLLVLLVSSMDYYLGCLIKNKILVSPKYKEKYMAHKRSKKKCFEDLNINKLLRTESFQNQTNIQTLLDKIFNIDIQLSDGVNIAVRKRNKIIHNNKRDVKGEEIIVQKTELLAVKKDIDKFLHNIREGFLSLQIDRIIKH